MSNVITTAPARFIDNGCLLEGEALIRVASHAAARYGNGWYRAHIIMKKALMVVANVVLNAFSTENILAPWLASGWLAPMRYMLIAVLASGTIYSNIFAKVPMLDDELNGLGLTQHEKRLARALESGLIQASLFPNRHIELVIHTSDMLTLYSHGDISLSRLRLLVHLLRAQYCGIPGGGYRSISVSCINESGVSREIDTLYSLDAHYDGRLVVCVDCQNYQGQRGDVLLPQSAMPLKQYSLRHPVKTAIHLMQWVVIRGGLAFAVINTLNHSAHNLQQRWLGLSAETNLSWKVAAWLANIIIGSYRALAGNSIQGHKTCKELLLLRARIQHGKFGLPTAKQWLALLYAAFFIGLSLVFNVNMALYFGGVGIDTAVKQVYELLGYDSATVMAPSWAKNSAVLFCLVTNVIVAIATTCVETYRLMEVKSGARQKLARVNDRSHTVHQKLWRSVCVATVVDSANYAMVAANSAFQAWANILKSHTAGLVSSGAIYISIFATMLAWSLSTARTKFPNVLHSMFGSKVQQQLINTESRCYRSLPR